MSFRSTRLPLAHGALPCHESGSGDPVLYLHSAGGVRLSPGLERLAQRRRVVIPVLPGFDDSEPRAGIRSMPELADLAAEAIEAAIGRSCDVVGYSFGAAVAAWLAIRHPGRVQQLVLSGLSATRSPALPADPKRLRALAFAHPENLAEDKPAVLQAANFAAARGYGAADERDLENRLGAIEALTLILHGTKDGIVPPEEPRLAKQRLKRSYLVYVYDAAHAIDWDQPERFAGLIDDFLSRGEAFIVHRNEN